MLALAIPSRSPYIRVPISGAIPIPSREVLNMTARSYATGTALGVTLAALGAFGSALSSPETEISRSLAAAATAQAAVDKAVQRRAAAQSATAIDELLVHLSRLAAPSGVPATGLLRPVVAVGETISIGGGDGTVRSFEIIDVADIGHAGPSAIRNDAVQSFVVTARGRTADGDVTIRLVVDAPAKPRTTPVQPSAL